MWLWTRQCDWSRTRVDWAIRGSLWRNKVLSRSGRVSSVVVNVSGKIWISAIWKVFRKKYCISIFYKRHHVHNKKASSFALVDCFYYSTMSTDTSDSTSLTNQNATLDDLLVIAQSASYQHPTGTASRDFRNPFEAEAESIMRREENRSLAAWRAKQSPETIAKWGRWAQPQNEGF